MAHSVQLAALWQQVAPPEFTDYWAPMIALAGQLAARRQQNALPRHLAMDLAFQMIGLIGQLAAGRLQLPSLGVSQWIGYFLGSCQ